jgi:hypothetical protein
MKKILLTILFSLFCLTSLPLTINAYCSGPSYDKNASGPGMEYCVCLYPTLGTYPDCRCPAGKEISGNSCICPFGQVPSGSGCVAQVLEEGQRYILEEQAKFNCSDRRCNGNGTNGISKTEWTMATYTSGGCSCPPGYTIAYGSSDVYSGCYENSAGQMICNPGFDNYDYVTGGSPSSSSSTSTTSGRVVGGGISTSTGNPNTQQITLPKVTSTGTVKNPLSSSTFQDLLNKLIDWILSIALVVAPLIIVYGGFLHVTAMGEMEKINKGRKIILYASIGFLVALMAKSLVPLFVDLVVK